MKDLEAARDALVPAPPRRPRIGLVDGEYVAIEVLNDNGEVVWYSDSIDGNYDWPPSADFTPVVDLPEPRMDEPQETWATVVAMANTAVRPDATVFVRHINGLWYRILAGGKWGVVGRPWDELIYPRPTTPTERATGIVGGEDQ